MNQSKVITWAGNDAIFRCWPGHAPLLSKAGRQGSCADMGGHFTDVPERLHLDDPVFLRAKELVQAHRDWAAGGGMSSQGCLFL